MLSQPTLWIQVVFVFFLFIANFAILFGPLLLMNMTQVRGFEPGDAEWGVKLEDVRGQAEAKEEVRRVVALWQSGEAFERRWQARAGPALPRRTGHREDDACEGDRDRFQLTVRVDSGLGFAATFIGIDAIVVRYVARKAKRLARKWGGQCIVFIDEIDAVGMRRQALNPGLGGAARASASTVELARLPLLRPERRAQPDRRPDPRVARLARPALRRAGAAGGDVRPVQRVNGVADFMLPGHGRRRRARAQPAARRDGRDRQPALHAAPAHQPLNTFLDACYVVPRRVHGRSLRLPAPKPRGPDLLRRRDERADRPAGSALTGKPHGPSRLVPVHRRSTIASTSSTSTSGRSPTTPSSTRFKAARRDRAGHARLLARDDRPGRLDGVDDRAPHGRERFGWDDLVEAVTTLESGTAVGMSTSRTGDRQVAIHEAGHAGRGSREA